MVNTLHIIPSLFSNTGGLPFAASEAISSEAKQSGGQTNVVVVNQEFADKQSLLFNRLLSSGVKVNFLNQITDKNKQLVDLHGKINPDVIVLWLPELVKEIGESLKQFKNPTILRASTTYNDNAILPETRALYNECFNIILSKPNSLIICNSNHTKDWNNRNFAISNHQQKVIVEGIAQNGPIDTELNFKKEFLGINKNAYVVSNITRITASSGSINLRKDPFGFVLAASHLSNKNPDTVFIMCGEGAKWNNMLIQKIISLANSITGGSLTQSNFRMLGHVENVANIINISNVQTALAGEEGFGRTPVEAMKLGVPSIVTNTGIMPEMNGKIASVIPVREFGYENEKSYIGDKSSNLVWVKEFEEKFYNLRNRSEAKIRADSVYLIQRASKEYDMDSVARKYLDTYQQVLDNSRIGSVLRQENIDSANKSNGVIHS